VVETVRTSRLDADQVMVAAEALVTEQGWDALTMAAVAAKIGVRAPSLYRHVESLDALRHAMRMRSLMELSDAVRAAVMGKAGIDGLHALTDAYRTYATQHPVRYLAQSGLPGDQATRAASRRIGEAGYAVLASFGLDEAELPVATAQLAALLHGFVSLELAQTIDWVTDPNAAFQGLIEIFAAGLGSEASRQAQRQGKGL
jgi:AcrR family transcriptional regulator